MPDMDRLTEQLYYLPNIIERLGLGIAEAQKGLNADYVDNVGKLMNLIKDFVGGEAFVAGADDEKKAEARRVMKDLLMKLGPSKYQFTKTTLQFQADLSESVEVAGSGGVGFGLGAVTVNASAAFGFARDYRAAAEITTVLDAIPMEEGDALLTKLLGSADAIKKIALPADRPEVDQAIHDSLSDVAKRLEVMPE